MLSGYDITISNVELAKLLVSIRQTPSLLNEKNNFQYIESAINLLNQREWLQIIPDRKKSLFSLLLLCILEGSVPEVVLNKFQTFTLLESQWLERLYDETFQPHTFDKELLFSFYPWLRYSTDESSIMSAARMILPPDYDDIKSTHHTIFDIFLKGIQNNCISLEIFIIFLNKTKYNSTEEKLIGKIFKEYNLKKLSAANLNEIILKSNALVLSTIEKYSFRHLSDLLELVLNKVICPNLVVDLLLKGVNNQDFKNHQLSLKLSNGDDSILVKLLLILNKFNYSNNLSSLFAESIDYIFTNLNYYQNFSKIIPIILDLIRSKKLPILILRKIFYIPNLTNSQIKEHLTNTEFNWHLNYFNFGNLTCIISTEHVHFYLNYHYYNNLPLPIMNINNRFNSSMTEYYEKILMTNTLIEEIEIDLTSATPIEIKKIGTVIAQNSVYKSITVTIDEDSLSFLLNAFKTNTSIRNFKIILHYTNFTVNQNPDPLTDFFQTAKLNSFIVTGHSRIVFYKIFDTLHSSQSHLKHIGIACNVTNKTNISKALSMLNPSVTRFDLGLFLHDTEVDYLGQCIAKATQLKSFSFFPIRIPSSKLESLAATINESFSLRNLKLIDLSIQNIPLVIYLNKLLENNQQITTYKIESSYDFSKELQLYYSFAALLTNNRNITSLKLPNILLKSDDTSVNLINNLHYLSIVIDAHNIDNFSKQIVNNFHLSELKIILWYANIEYRQIIDLLNNIIKHTEIKQLKFYVRKKLTYELVNIHYPIIQNILPGIENSHLFSLKTNVSYPVINNILIPKQRKIFLSPLYLIYYHYLMKIKHAGIGKPLSHHDTEVDNEENSLNLIKKIELDAPEEIFLHIISFLPRMNAKRIEYYQAIIQHKLSTINKLQ